MFSPGRFLRGVFEVRKSENDVRTSRNGSEALLLRWRVWLTPLCPAGHLPHKEGDRMGDCSPLIPQRSRWPGANNESISPPVGEMPGKAEGGKRHPRRSPHKTKRAAISGDPSALRWNF
ncbi:hypothetical protein CTT39_15920 [Agrobacterium rosae]|nr:hypothetical protein CTT39_15920 [Agrobacterium rosae]